MSWDKPSLLASDPQIHTHPKLILHAGVTSFSECLIFMYIILRFLTDLTSTNWMHLFMYNIVSLQITQPQTEHVCLQHSPPGPVPQSQLPTQRSAFQVLPEPITEHRQSRMPWCRQLWHRRREWWAHVWRQLHWCNSTFFCSSVLTFVLPDFF